MLKNAKEENVQPCSVDVRIGKIFKLKSKGIIDVDSNMPEAVEVQLPYVLKPGEYVLASTIERIDQEKTNYGVLATPRSIAYRIGLRIECGIFHPHYKGEMVFAMKNNSPNQIRIKYGMSVMQLGFFDLKSDCIPLKHRYQEGRII
jgi:deoxycytidine triphosphate deaminase